MAPTTCWNLRVSAEANQGGRKYMEDVTAVHFERTNGVEFASFAIFDGHGGREASHFAKVSPQKRTIHIFRPGDSDGKCPLYRNQRMIFVRDVLAQRIIYFFHRIN